MCLDACSVCRLVCLIRCCVTWTESCLSHQSDNLTDWTALANSLTTFLIPNVKKIDTETEKQTDRYLCLCLCHH